MYELMFYCPKCGNIEDIEFEVNKDIEIICDNCGSIMNINIDFIEKNLSKTILVPYINYDELPENSIVRKAYDEGYEDSSRNNNEISYDEGYEDGRNDAFEHAKEKFRISTLTKSEFLSILNLLNKWRKDRRISFHTQKTTFINNINEEIEEYYNKGLDENYNIKDKHEYIDALADIMVIIINSNINDDNVTSSLSKLMDNEGFLINLNEIFFKEDLKNYWENITKNGTPNETDVYIFTSRILNTIFFSGYNPYDIMVEAIREISARTQDPIQQEKWKEMEENGILIEEKWEKDKNPEVQKTWYKANYNNALR